MHILTKIIRFMHLNFVIDCYIRITDTHIFARFARFTNPCPNPRQPCLRSAEGGGGGGEKLVHLSSPACPILYITLLVFQYWGIGRLEEASYYYIWRRKKLFRKKNIFARILPEYKKKKYTNLVHWLGGGGGHSAPSPSPSPSIVLYNYDFFFFYW